MPTYGYECTACSDHFETVQSIRDAVLTTCEKCGGALRKLIYPVGIAFKGSGFYVNDYAAKPSAGPVSKTPDVPGESKSDTAATPDVKTEVKTESAAAPPAEAKTPAPAAA